MYGDTTLIAQGWANGQLNNLGAEYNARRFAAQKFWNLHFNANMQRLWRLLTRKPCSLQNLETVEHTQTIHGRRYLGLQTVPLSQIVGSEGRSRDFDAAFRPLKSHNRDRWMGIAVAHMLKITLPPVELVQIGSRYFVRDGNHRISVALSFGQTEIDAQVTLWQTNIA